MTRRQILEQIIKENPKAKLVANKYRVLAGMIQRMYPEMREIPQMKLGEIIFDSVQADRELRLLTVGEDVENKNRLEEQYVLKLGFKHTP